MSSNALVFRVELPPAYLSPNQARHVPWKLKNDTTVTYKLQVQAECANAMRRARWVVPVQARVSLLWGLHDARSLKHKNLDPRYHPEDSDNAIEAAKPLFDGLTLAGAIVDDRWESMVLGGVTATRTEGPWVEVTIEALG